LESIKTEYWSDGVMEGWKEKISGVKQ